MKTKISPETFNSFLNAVDLADLTLIESSSKFDISFFGATMQFNIRDSFKHFETDSGFRIEARMALTAKPEEAEKPAVVVIAKYSVVFSLNEKFEGNIPKDLVTLFYDRSVAMIVWTYYREHVNSMTTKMGLPALNLPLRKR